MRIIASSIAAIVLVYVTNTEAFSVRYPVPPQLIHRPGMDILMDILKLLDTTHLPPPTTTTTPSPPPNSPLLWSDYLDDLIIESCLEDMTRCSWNIDELADVIERRSNIDRNMEYDGQGEPVGPAVDPNEIDENKVSVGSTEQPEKQSPGAQPSEKHTPGKQPLEKHTPGKQPLARGGVPAKCLPFGEKNMKSRKYRINCKKYLSDSSLKYYYQRRNAMIGCFKCRKLCENYGEIQYL